MTLEVYNTNSGIPMGKAEIGGGAKSDGALYQYMGSVATYAALELLDTTDFKPGYVYDVQEDGMDYAWTGEAWNALGTHTDLTGYYTKIETDALLANKANVSDLSNKVTGVGISEMQALTQTEYDEIGKYYAYEYNGTTVYVRKETPTTTDTVYSAIDTASALTITSVGTDSLTLSDSNTYARSAASDEVDDTQYDATTLYVVKNVVGE